MARVYDADVPAVRFGIVVGVSVAMLSAIVNIRSISNDNITNALIPASLVREGNLELSEFDRPDPARPGLKRYWLVRTERGVFARYPIWTGLVATPVFAPFVALGRGAIDEAALLRIGRLAALILCGTCGGLLAVTLRRFVSGSRAALLTLLTFHGTTLWHCLGSQLTNQTVPIVCMALILCLLTWPGMTPRRARAAGLTAGLAIAARLPIVCMALAPLGLFLGRRAWRRFLPHVFAGALVFPCLTLIYNAAAFGHPLRTGYSAEPKDRFSGPALDGLTGLLFSPTCGLLVYSPFLAFGLMGGAACLRTHVRRRSDRRADNRAATGRERSSCPDSGRLHIPMHAGTALKRPRRQPLGGIDQARSPDAPPAAVPALPEAEPLAHHDLGRWILLGAAGQWLLFARWWAWEGGLVFGGSRMLAEVIPGLAVLIAIGWTPAGRRHAPPARSPSAAPSRPPRRGATLLPALGLFSILVFLAGTVAYDAIAPNNPEKPQWDLARDFFGLYLDRFGLTALLTAMLKQGALFLATLLAGAWLGARFLVTASSPAGASPRPRPSES